MADIVDHVGIGLWPWVLYRHHLPRGALVGSDGALPQMSSVREVSGRAGTTRVLGHRNAVSPQMAKIATSASELADANANHPGPSGLNRCSTDCVLT